MRIELLGPSGAGKTTVLRAAERLRSPEREWLGPFEIDPLIRSLKSNDEVRRGIDVRLPPGYAERCLEIAVSSRMLASQKMAAIGMLRTSCWDILAICDLPGHHLLVHDELLLHRAFSLLPHSANIELDAAWYFDNVPLPNAAVVVRAEADTILQRTIGRGRLPNCYFGFDQVGLRSAIARSLEIAEIAEKTLKQRGIPVMVVDTEATAEQNGRSLHEFIIQQDQRDRAPDITARLVAASRSFRKREGRHELRTKDVIYCAFDTPCFSVGKHEAQRDAKARLARFGLGREQVEGRKAIDLGCNAGAMLFELSNLSLGSGLGLEYDQDKVDLANEIASYSNLSHLRFEQADIDHLDAVSLGAFDIVMALAIEAHILDPDRLYTLLGHITADILCFEGNGNCDANAVENKLKAVGFSSIKYIGLCDDDIDPKNNNRPMLVARK